MITLRDLCRTDKAIASITTGECHFMASVMLFTLSITQRWYLRWVLPHDLKEAAFQLRMLAAILGRTAREREPSVPTQIRLAMEQDRKA